MPNKLNFPPAIKPGPLSRVDADNLNRSLQALYSFANGLAVTAPLVMAENYGGLQIGIDPSLGNGQGGGSAGSGETFDHNGTFVGTEPILNVKDAADGSVTWTMADVPGSSWVTMTPAIGPYTSNSTITINSGNTVTYNGSGGITFNSTLTGITINAPVEICGLQFWCCVTYTLASASVNDLNLSSLAGNKTVYNITTVGSNSTITGFVPANYQGAAGPEIIAIVNVDGTKSITINNQSASSAAANRVILPPTYGGGVTLAPNDSIVLWYDTCTSNRWRVLACTVDTDSAGGATNSNAWNTLGVNYSLTGSLANVGVSVTLPVNGGVYLVWAVIAMVMGGTVANGDQITARLQDTTNAITVLGTNVVMQFGTGVSTMSGNNMIQAIYTTSSVNTVINLQASTTGTGTNRIDSVATTGVGFVRLA